jgi:MFS transporter, MHS family, proline/betaine transporter
MLSAGEYHLIQHLVGGRGSRRVALSCIAEGNAMPAIRSTPKPLQVAAAVIGNALEWYDFIIFGFLTVVISKLFFPTDSQYTSLMLTTATFGAGFLMRPIGGIFLGIYADRKGRKAALQLIIGLMTIAIAIITFAPTYAAIGVAAPLSILIARLLQGLATGGEWGCSTAFLIESAPADQRGFYGSWQMTGQGLALLAGALVSFFVTRIFTPEAFESWGWRIPFLLGLFIGPVGIFIRRHLNETDAFLELRPDKQENQFVSMVAHISRNCWFASASTRVEPSHFMSSCFTCRRSRPRNSSFRSARLS